MKQLPSQEFRKVYPRLTEPVEVTALGRVIGRYVPVGAEAISIEPPTVKVAGVTVANQAQRDAILRRVNRAG